MVPVTMTARTTSTWRNVIICEILALQPGSDAWAGHSFSDLSAGFAIYLGWGERSGRRFVAWMRFGSLRQSCSLRRKRLDSCGAGI
jgi:hypothetical protein